MQAQPAMPNRAPSPVHRPKNKYVVDSESHVDFDLEMAFNHNTTAVLMPLNIMLVTR
jgi:hypothetical protein